MENQISLQQINNFSKEYNKDTANKVIENKITQNGIENTCINQDVIKENPPIFNIELPESKRYHQKESHKCWIFAGINTIKYNIAENLKIDVIDLELSDNYIAFFDKLEKSNNTYENIIALENTDLTYVRKENILKFCVSEGGYWQWFVAIINKYGMVPMNVMPNVVESINYEKIDAIFTEKVKKDAIYLLELKNKKESLEKLREAKNKFLQENYNLLSKILGEPKFTFDYVYKDKNNKTISYPNMTPADFRDKFLTLNLNDFVSIGNLPMYNKQYDKIYAKKYLGNIYQRSRVTFLNLPVEELKDLAIKQLKDGIPVWLGIYHKKFRDKKSGVLDLRLYDCKEMLGVTPLNKKEALNTNDIWLDHAMTFCGVHLVKGKSIRWKVEDSKGDEEKANGYYIMNDNYFDAFVLNIIIDKKYLSNKQLQLLEQEPIEIEVTDSF